MYFYRQTESKWFSIIHKHGDQEIFLASVPTLAMAETLVLHLNTK